MRKVFFLLVIVTAAGLLPPLSARLQASETPANVSFQVFLPLVATGKTVNPGNPGNPPPASFFIPGEAPTRNFEVEYDAQGRMHLVFVRHTRTEGVQELVYGTCAPGADCDRAANWQLVVIHQGAIGVAQIDVTRDGRPRLAVQDEQTLNTFRLLYLACEANCLTASNWWGLGLARNLERIDAFTEYVNHRWFALTPQGNPRILLALNDVSYYLACDANCTSLENAGWVLTDLDATGQEFGSRRLYSPVLKIDANGRAHVLGTISQQQLVYMTCAAGCDQPGNWERAILADYTNGQGDQLPVSLLTLDFDLEIDRTGHVVVAFGGVLPGQNGPQRAYIWRCAADCVNLMNWSGRSFPDTPSSGLDLAIDPRNRPWYSLLGKVAATEERIAQIATCDTANCYDPGARWTARTVSSSNQMEAEFPMKRQPQTPAVCSVATTSWEHGGNYVVFTPAGKMRLVTSAVATSICQPGMDEWIDQWGTKKRGRTIDVWVINARARWTIVP